MDSVNLEVRIGRRTFHTSAKQIYANRPVFILNVPPSPAGLLWLVSWLPIFLCRWLHQHTLREWFLPDTVVLKKRSPEKTSVDHANELAIYQHLESLQGDCIPRVFGTARVTGPGFKDEPSMLLEYISGRALCDLPREDPMNAETLVRIDRGERINEPPSSDNVLHPRLSNALEHTYCKLTEAGIVHGDPTLANFIRRDDNGAIVAIDFEFASRLPYEVDHDMELQTIIDVVRFDAIYAAMEKRRIWAQASSLTN